MAQVELKNTVKIYDKKKIIDNWNSLDDCLCDVFDSFSDCKFEY